MAFIEKIVGGVNDAMYTYILVALLVLGGIFFTFRTRFAPFRLLGEQIKADCPNFKLTFNAIENIVEAEENDYDFREFSNRVSELNGTYDIHVYYEGNNTVQASVELEAYERPGGWNDIKYNDYRPILVFAADDSQYQFENYFSESSFSDLIDAFEELINSFYNLVD